MTKNMFRVCLLAILLLIPGCRMNKEKIDLLVRDATVYTVDDTFSIVEAFAVRDGRIIDRGTTREMKRKYLAGKVLSLAGKFVYPGWNDGHCHFIGYGLSLNQADLSGTSSPGEVVDRCRAFADNFPGEWITGRGWDQNDWPVKAFPSREDLDKAFPDRPVLLRRIDGHAAWVNTKALEIAGITGEENPSGGEILLKDGVPTGILIDNAIDLVSAFIPDPGTGETINGILSAEKNCFAVGLTSVTDAGLSRREVLLLDSLHREGILQMRINAMLAPSAENFREIVSKGRTGSDRLTVGTLKLYADGALGSRGARMIEPYSDDPGNRGLFLTQPGQLREYCRIAYENNFQVAIHCIGDEANREVLGIYSEILKGQNDRRWRIEHAQVINPADFSLFGRYAVVPSVQPTHATSDMYWAEERLGEERLKGAYSFKTLLDQNGRLVSGSDFPVESINPLYGFYSAISRKDHSGYPEKGYLPGEALSREEALRAMTIWAAWGAFEEAAKGSIEPGKLADFVVTDQDIMIVPEEQVPGIKVFATYSGGLPVYER